MSDLARQAAEDIASWLRLEAHQFPSDGNVAEWSEIIDEAFAPAIAELVGLLRRVGEAGLNLLACDLMDDIRAAIAKHGGEA